MSFVVGVMRHCGEGAQKGCGCSIPGSLQSHVAQGPEPFHLMQGAPAHGGGI